MASRLWTSISTVLYCRRRDTTIGLVESIAITMVDSTYTWSSHSTLWCTNTNCLCLPMCRRPRTMPTFLTTVATVSIRHRRNGIWPPARPISPNIHPKNGPLWGRRLRSEVYVGFVVLCVGGYACIVILHIDVYIYSYVLLPVYAWPFLSLHEASSCAWSTMHALLASMVLDR